MHLPVVIGARVVVDGGGYTAPWNGRVGVVVRVFVRFARVENPDPEGNAREGGPEHGRPFYWLSYAFPHYVVRFEDGDERVFIEGHLVAPRSRLGLIARLRYDGRCRARRAATTGSR